jgi:hypothetical protein
MKITKTTPATAATSIHKSGLAPQLLIQKST